MKQLVIEFLNHLEDVLSDKDFEKVDVKLWNALAQKATEQ